jgi:hypothetical protein
MGMGARDLRPILCVTLDLSPACGMEMLPGTSRGSTLGEGVAGSGLYCLAPLALKGDGLLVVIRKQGPGQSLSLLQSVM